MAMTREQWIQRNRAQGGSGSEQGWNAYSQRQPGGYGSPGSQPPGTPPQAPQQPQGQQYGQPPQQPAGGGMDYATWEARGKAKSGADWNQADAANQYRMYQLRRQGVGHQGAAGGAAQAIDTDKYAGTDSTGLRAYSDQYGMGSHGYGSFDDATLQVWKETAWDDNCPPHTPFQAFDGSGCVEKPIDSAHGSGSGGRAAGASGWQQAGQGGGGGGGGAGGYGGAPQFNYGDFRPPSYEEAQQDPGYQFALNQGLEALQRKAGASGNLLSGNTDRAMVDYATGLASQQYGDVYNRAANTYGTNRQTAGMRFDPKYGAWQTQYGGNLSKWSTRYGGDLQRDLQKEGNIYNLLSQPPPVYGGY